MISVVIVGLGSKGDSLLRALHGKPRLKILGVADVNPRAPGMELARKLGISCHSDATALVSDPAVDLIVHATGDRRVYEWLHSAKHQRAVVVEAPVLKLVMSLVEAEEGLLREREVILNSTHDAMIAIDARGLVTLVNPSAERFLGVEARELLGRPAREVIPGTRLHIVVETGVAELNQQQQMGSTTIITNRVPVRDDGGRVVGAVAVFRDITEVKSLAEEITNLKEIRTLLEAIINSTQDAIQVVDAEGKGLLINPAYTRLTGLTEEDVIGKPATVDIAEGESMHMKVLNTRQPVRGARMKVGPGRKDVLVNVAPIVVDEVLKGSVAVIHDTSEIIHLTEELDRVRRLVRRLEAKYTFDEIVARSAMMRAAVEQARRAADTPATVLLRGESGTGKELFAHAIHNASRRRGGQFIRVNCAAISDSLLESELFGYVEGAFTGARRGGRRGLFEEASGGTIFLDEIGAVSLNLQAKLLRVLQEREIVRVGDTKPLSVDVRVIAATNVHLERAVESAAFREDLYYRLNVVPVFIPPLRHRLEDIPELVHHLIRKFNQEYGRCVQRVTDDVLRVFTAYDWPGNVRELENVLGRAMINANYQAAEIDLEHLPALGRYEALPKTGNPLAGKGLQWIGRKLGEVLAEVEREVIALTLERTRGNKTEAARLLGIAPRSLYYKLDRLQEGKPGRQSAKHGMQ